MPLFNVDIEKVLGGEYWTNRYIVQAADIGAAYPFATALITHERTIHNVRVSFTKARLSDQQVGTDVYTTIPINDVGMESATAPYLPLFNVVRIDFGTLHGRPSRKYLRLPVLEDQQTDGVLSPALRTFLFDNYATHLVTMTSFVDVDGEAIVNASVHPNVGMRQLRRGSKRRLQPVLP